MPSRQLISTSLKTSTSFILALCTAISAPSSYADISQKPLLLGGGSVPGNLALVPSVEWPTILSVANLGNYNTTTKFAGYFDSDKCYQYAHDSTNSDRRNSHFYPASISATRNCAGNLWSGNYLNWAATQTIDPFRSALTGGLRVRDTPTETWLEKARHTGQNSSGNLGIAGAAQVQNATPAAWSNFKTRLSGLGNKMRFTNTGDLSGTASDYTPSTDLTGKDNSVYEVYIRVKVCDPAVGLEPNCERYSQGFKPQGLIQQYSDQIRFSVFGYLNDSAILRDGGVLRAQQKFVGAKKRTPGVSGSQANPAKEWDEVTGVMIKNPDTAAATATNAGIQDSGVINYLNKFGQMTTANHKSIDPVSELFYTSLRYFKNQGNVPAYTDITGSAAASYQLADGFPVITNWDDPIQYACQKNVILGIGDTNTHRDKNLPGNTNNSEEPATPTQVSSDNTINAATATQKVAQLEGITINTPFTGRGNSAYIAGLAYDANTKDLRPTISGKQTVSTYWVDVRENATLAGRTANQYWLAAKYGGFKVPSNFGDPYARTEALQTEWWRTNTDMLATNYPRPDNFFVASDANNMVESLRKAFAQISNEVQSTTASLATNSTRLETDTAVFQSLVDSRYWSGDLSARRVNANGVVELNKSWSAAQKLDSLSDTDSRKIYTITPTTTAGSNNELIATSGTNFTWSNLSSGQKSALQLSSEPTNVVAQLRLNYLRGDRTLEITTDDRTRIFRQRGSRLGDIVNSDPQFIHKQDFGYSRLSWNNGSVGSAYTSFRTSSAYQNRTPLVVVGANDGMLHGFDARVGTTSATNGGDELFAYVPNSVYGNLASLTDPAYSHRYFVDGTPRVSDVYAGGSWKTMVVGTTGAGGKSVFALDITNPSSMNSSKVMWEFSHPDMGYTMGQPALVALPNEKFGVIVSSGYHDNAPANGKIWILDAENGSIIRQITLPTTGNLGSPLAADTDYNQVADRVYVADTLGNVWRIDLPESNTSRWGTPSSLGSNPLFIAKDASGNRQAITAPLASAFNDKNQHMVFFGTGSFYQSGDNEIPASPRIDTFYGIIDAGSPINGRSTLLKQSVIKEATLANNKKVRAITSNTLTTQSGWYLDLGWIEGGGATGAKGERVVAKATLRNDRVIYTTLTPSSDPCAAGGESFIMAMNLSSGARLNYVYFDTSGNGQLGNEDTSTIGTEENVPWSGISDTGDGVIKGVTPLFKWLCFAGSNGGTPQCIPVAGSQRFGRQTWREVRAE